MRKYPNTAKGSDNRSDPVTPVAVVANVQPLPDGENRGGEITTGGEAQVLAPANPDRTFLRGQNVSEGDLWISEITDQEAGPEQPAFLIPSKATFNISTAGEVTVFGATTGQGWAATEG